MKFILLLSAFLGRTSIPRSLLRGCLFCFKSLILIAINCGLAIFLFVISIVAILIFGIILLNPNRLDKEVEKMKKGAENIIRLPQNQNLEISEIF
ncbi:MAG: hypothetical protein NC314_08850 [Roseburia sp.]|nr:hypothetical protein [Roseburia sp.]MCM1242935.1 hypothetical protein [Roseburia sp.]